VADREAGRHGHAGLLRQTREISRSDSRWRCGFPRNSRRPVNGKPTRNRQARGGRGAPPIDVSSRPNRRSGGRGRVPVLYQGPQAPWEKKIGTRPPYFGLRRHSGRKQTIGLTAYFLYLLGLDAPATSKTLDVDDPGARVRGAMPARIQLALGVTQRTRKKRGSAALEPLSTNRSVASAPHVRGLAATMVTSRCDASHGLW